MYTNYSPFEKSTGFYQKVSILEQSTIYNPFLSGYITCCIGGEESNHLCHFFCGSCSTHWDATLCLLESFGIHFCKHLGLDKPRSYAVASNLGASKLF